MRFDEWDEFKSCVTRLVEGRHPGAPPLPELVFRGQASSRYELTASLDRAHPGLDVRDLNALQTRLLEVFRRRRPEFAESADEEALAVLQHYGAPTRILDWTTSPYVAAFFAASGALEPEVDDEYFVVWALRRDARPLEAGIALSEPSFTANDRSRAQRGLFLVNTSLSRTVVDHLDDWHRRYGLDEIVLWAFLVPRAAARTARRDLAAMGVDFESLFPDLGGVARAAYLTALEASEPAGDGARRRGGSW